MLANAFVAFVPVLLFLAVLVLMDSFKLARPSAIAGALVWGVVAAVIGNAIYPLHGTIAVSATAYSRFVAPISEEVLKAAFIVYLIRRRRIGFPVDAAQLGFAVGTGFAVVENFEYLRVLSGAGIVLWIVRGLGTAMLHGATTSVFAMLSPTATGRQEYGVAAFLPGMAAAIGIHAAFNLLPVSPVAKTAAILVILPLVVLSVFQRSERATREWVGAGLDLDLMLHETFASAALESTRFGSYLRELRQRFPGDVVVDMLCLLRVEVELSIQAKAVLIARNAGVTMPVHPDARSAVDEIRQLRESIGQTGLLALGPVHVTTFRDDWHRYLLTGSESTEHRRPSRAAWLAGLSRRRSDAGERPPKRDDELS
jgi:RsiW-degrading membrane proteinase PrsW (M82 family)